MIRSSGLILLVSLSLAPCAWAGDMNKTMREVPVGDFGPTKPWQIQVVDDGPAVEGFVPGAATISMHGLRLDLDDDMISAFQLHVPQNISNVDWTYNLALRYIDRPLKTGQQFPHLTDLYNFRIHREREVGIPDGGIPVGGIPLRPSAKLFNSPDGLKPRKRSKYWYKETGVRELHPALTPGDFGSSSVDIKEVLKKSR